MVVPRFALIGCIATAMAGAVEAQPKADSVLSARVAAAVRARMQDQMIPGVSLAVVRDGKIIMSAGYGLANVAAFCGVEFRHHDALEDARAAALVLLHAMDHVGLDLNGWRRRIRQPIFPRPGGHGDSVACDGDPDGPLAGEVIVFTGALVMTRAEAAPTAAALGCNVRDTVTKATTILVVGLQDASKLKGYEKSSKHRKAETMIRGGAPLRILSEQDFMGLTRMLDAVPA